MIGHQLGAIPDGIAPVQVGQELVDTPQTAFSIGSATVQKWRSRRRASWRVLGGALAETRDKVPLLKAP